MNEKLKASFVLIYCTDKPLTYKIDTPTTQMGVLTICRRDGLFGLPGGKPDKGETDIEALVREVNEELGYMIDINKVIDNKILSHRNSIVHLYKLKLSFNEICDIVKNAISHSCKEEISGLMINPLNDNTIDNVLSSKFTDYISEEIYSLYINKES